MCADRLGPGVLFSTSPGERVNGYDYVCNLRQYALEPLSEQLTVRMWNEITRAVILFEPRIELEDVLFEGGDECEYLISLSLF